MNTSYRQPIVNAPAVVKWLAGLCVGVHLVRLFLPDSLQSLLILNFAFYPARYGVPDLWMVNPVSTLISPVSYTFLHAGWLHLLVNMAMLLAFGAAVARRLSMSRFLVLYFGGGIAGAAATLLVDPTAAVPVVGASAAISALVGAIALMALSRHRTAPRPFHDRRTAWSFIFIWLALNLVFGVIPGESLGVSGRIAWEAHLGGFLAGFLLLPLLDPPARGRPPTF